MMSCVAMPHVHLWCCPGLANGHVPKKQKRNKKEDALPSLDAMLADGIASSGAQQQPGTDFTWPTRGCLAYVGVAGTGQFTAFWSLQSMHPDESKLLEWHRGIGGQRLQVQVTSITSRCPASAGSMTQVCTL